MKFSVTGFLVLLALAAEGFAAFTVNTPNSAWTAGSQVTVSWINDGGSNPSTLTFTLMDGSNSFNNANAVANLGTAQFSAGKATFNLPSSITSGTKYFLRVGTSTSDYKYTGAITINGGSAAVSSTASAATSAAATSAATTAASVTSATVATTTTDAAKTTTAKSTTHTSATSETSSTSTTTTESTPTETGLVGSAGKDTPGVYAVVAAGAVVGSYLLL